MQFPTKQWAIAGVVLVAVLVGAGAWRERAIGPAVSVATSTSSAASSTPGSAQSGQVAPSTAHRPFPINAADTIASWNFKGAYTGNSALMSKADSDSAHLTSLLGKGQYDDYDLYIGIGNDANLNGDGKAAYDAYNRAIAILPDKGLAYANLGHLFDELGAYHTAVDAYAQAVAVEPSVLEYHIERLSFLTRQFPTDTALITAALAAASRQFGDTPSILAIEAQWLTGQGRYADAIKAWETVKMLSPQDRQAPIDAEIARLKAKQ